MVYKTCNMLMDVYACSILEYMDPYSLTWTHNVALKELTIIKI